MRADEAFANGRFAEARAAYEAVIQSDRGNPALWVGLAAAHLELGNFMDVITSAQRAIELDQGRGPAGLRACKCQGRALQAVGRHDVAMQVYDQAFEEHYPNDAELTDLSEDARARVVRPEVPTVERPAGPLCVMADRVDPTAGLEAIERAVRPLVDARGNHPVPLELQPGERADVFQRREAAALSAALGWREPVGLFGYSHDGYYKDLWVYYDRADRASPLNELATRAFSCYGPWGDPSPRAPPVTIRGAVVVIRLDPDPNFAPPPPWRFDPSITPRELALTLDFFRRTRKTARKIALERDAHRMAGPPSSVSYVGPSGATRPMDKVYGKDVESCAGCGKPRVRVLKLKACSRCKSVCYCSKECQTQHWPAHKQQCHQEQQATS